MGATYKECDKCHELYKIESPEQQLMIRLYDSPLPKFGMREGCYSWIGLCPECEVNLVNMIREFEGKTLVQ